MRPLAPNARTLATTQDRLEEKNFIAKLGIPTAPYAAVASEAELAEAIDRIGRPAVLKTRRFGYDGKGQVMIRPDTDTAEAFAAVGGAASILEGFVPFERELSVVAARTASRRFRRLRSVRQHASEPHPGHHAGARPGSRTRPRSGPS